MQYKLVNVAPGNLQVELHSPEKSYKQKNLNRPGKVVALRLERGESRDILPYFDGDMEKAHAAIKYSRDVLKVLKTNRMQVFVCDDNGKPVDVDALMGGKKAEVTEDATKPNMDTSAIMASQDQFEAEKTGEANPRPSEAEDTKAQKEDEKKAKEEAKAQKEDEKKAKADAKAKKEAEKKKKADEKAKAKADKAKK